jgi:plasmid stabilization system protein ParE
VSTGYRLTPEAQGAIEEIYAFVAEDRIDAALRVLEEFERVFERLATTPGIGHTREGVQDDGGVRVERAERGGRVPRASLPV